MLANKQNARYMHFEYLAWLLHAWGCLWTLLVQPLRKDKSRQHKNDTLKDACIPMAMP